MPVDICMYIYIYTYIHTQVAANAADPTARTGERDGARQAEAAGAGASGGGVSLGKEGPASCRELPLLAAGERLTPLLQQAAGVAAEYGSPM